MRRDGGFTLAEALVATVVAVFVAAVAALALSTGFRALGAISFCGTTTYDAVARLDALETLRMDIASALPVPRSFSASDRSFSCLALISPDRSDVSFREARVAWAADSSGAAVRRVAFSGEQPVAPEVVAGRGAAVNKFPAAWGAPVFEWTAAPPLSSEDGADSELPQPPVWRDTWTEESPPGACRVRWAGVQAVFSVMAGEDPKADGGETP